MILMLLIYLFVFLKIQFRFLIQKSFHFVLVGIPNTNGWNFVKRASIKNFNTIFKPLFLCFQEIGNDTMDAKNPFKVTLPNYKYFQKIMDSNMSGCRDLYLGYHVSYHIK